MHKIFNGYPFLLTTEKVLIHPKSNTGFIADVHLGKTTHFRKAGIAIPSNILNNDLDNILKIISQYSLEKLYILGDLFHSTLNNEWDIFLKFIAQIPATKFILIKGNHDILPQEAYGENLIVTEEPLTWNSFLLSHHPIDVQGLKQTPDLFNLAGHIHPGAIIKGKARSSLRIACYLERQNQLILPAFGRFTGLSIDQSKNNTKTYIIGPKKVFEIA